MRCRSPLPPSRCAPRALRPGPARARARRARGPSVGNVINDEAARPSPAPRLQTSQCPKPQTKDVLPGIPEPKAAEPDVTMNAPKKSASPPGTPDPKRKSVTDMSVDEAPEVPQPVRILDRGKGVGKSSKPAGPNATTSKRMGQSKSCRWMYSCAVLTSLRRLAATTVSWARP